MELGHSHKNVINIWIARFGVPQVDHLAPNPMSAKDTMAVASLKDAIPRTFTEHCLSLVDRIAHSVTSATAARVSERFSCSSEA